MQHDRGEPRRPRLNVVPKPEDAPLLISQRRFNRLSYDLHLHSYALADVAKRPPQEIKQDESHSLTRDGAALFVRAFGKLLDDVVKVLPHPAAELLIGQLQMFLYGLDHSFFDKCPQLVVVGSFTLIKTKQADPNDFWANFGAESVRLHRRMVGHLQ